MKWTLLIVFLYILPLYILYKGNICFKRKSIYGATYIVVTTFIIICNMYICSMNKIEENLAREKNYISNKYKKEEIDKLEKNKVKNKKIAQKKIDNKNKQAKKNNYNLNTPKEVGSLEIKYNEKDIITKFKKDIYKIERKALIPLRNCLPENKDLKINSKTIKKAKKDVSYAKKMCDEVVLDYENLNIPKLSSEENMNQLQYSKICMQKAYILRGKALECGQNLLNTKNLKYIKQIKEYINLSDNEIKKFVDTIDNL